MSSSVLLGLGSNSRYEGKKPVELLANACSLLGSVVTNIKMSSIYETKAMYVEDQENFFNMAVYGDLEESISPFTLLDEIHRIEALLGRDRSKEIRFGPRSLDIDIEDFFINQNGEQNNIVLNTENLILPHPRMHERAFVLIPSLEIFNKYADEKNRETFSSYLKNVEGQKIQKCPESVQKIFKQYYEQYSFGK